MSQPVKPERAERRIAADEIRDMERLVRMNLINSMTGFKSANLIGTVDGTGHPNLAIFNSVVHVGSDPPLMGLIIRPPVVPRHSYENMKETGYFTVNHVSRRIYTMAHQSSAKYERGISEFETVGLTPIVGKLHPAPYVAESKIRIGLALEEEAPIKRNGTIFVVGRVLELFVPDGVMGQDGFVDIESAGTVAVSGLDSYHETRRLDRLPFARP